MVRSRCARARSASVRLLACLVLADLFAAAHFTLAQSPAAGAARQIKVSIKPDYPTVAKRLSLTGAVRVEVQIAPDGKVKKAHVVGGHPVLAVEAEKAALLTEFEPGPRETTQVIEFHFGPSN